MPELQSPRLPLALSVCLIARDEAHNLPGLMASLRGAAKEIVVVDTGSIDGTPEVAASLGARVIESVWEDDFAKARNIALDAASSPWILSMDADQQLDIEALPALAAALERNDCDAQLVTIRLLGPPRDDGGDQVVQTLPSLRLFRRDPRIRYQGRVHEDVAGGLLAIGSSHWPDAGFSITDHGYMDALARQAKRDRNLRLLRRAHEEEPDSLFLAYKLAITLPDALRRERAQVLDHAMGQVCASASVDLKGLPFLARLVPLALSSWLDESRLADAADAALMLWRKVGPVFQGLAGEMLARAGRADEALEALRPIALGLVEPEPPSPLAPLAAVEAAPFTTIDWRISACRWLAWSAWKRGDLRMAASWVEQGRSMAGPKPRPTLEAVALGLRLDDAGPEGLAGEIEHLVNRAQVFEGLIAELTPVLMWGSAKAAEALGDTASALHFAGLAKDAPEEVGHALLAELHLQLSPSDPVVLQSLHAEIKGRCFDALALKVRLAGRVGLLSQIRLPESTRDLMALAFAR